MTERAKKYLHDVLKSITLIEDFMQGISSFDEYVKDDKTKSAVERHLGIIGEATGKLQKEFELAFENSFQIIGLRHRIIHAYDMLDDSVIWIVITKHLTPLKEEVSEKLQS